MGKSKQRKQLNRFKVTVEFAPVEDLNNRLRKVWALLLRPVAGESTERKENPNLTGISGSNGEDKNDGS